MNARVGVWLARADIALPEGELSDDERARARRLRNVDDRRRFVVAHVGLRRLLALHGAGAQASQRWPVDGGGKPGPVALPDGGVLHHNLSHAGEWIAIALSRDCAVGVDVEVLKPLDDMDALVDLAFTRSARQRWQYVPAPRRLAAFYRGWTQREAWLKADGRGLAAANAEDDDTEVSRRARLLVQAGPLVLATVALCRDARFEVRALDLRPEATSQSARTTPTSPLDPANRTRFEWPGCRAFARAGLDCC